MLVQKDSRNAQVDIRQNNVQIRSSTGYGGVELFAESKIDELTVTFVEFKALEELDVFVNGQPIAVAP